ncbi:MAG: DUF3619 family protein [Oleispira sp.]|jgi:hypothetical protein|nr:DUF3619 family protein [Oleispira sp.]
MNKPDSFEHSLQQQLDRSVDDLDDSTLSKLKAARRKALTAAPMPQHAIPREEGVIGNVISLNAFRQWPKPALGVAASLLLAAPLWYFNVNSPFDSEILQPNTIDLISSFAELDDDELDMVNELDFALWLVEQDSLNPAISG